MTTPPASNMFAQTTNESSRTLIIGLGDFGLEVVALLLSRLEVHRRFVLPETEIPQLSTRCGLIEGNAQGRAYAITTTDHQEHAFTHVRELQHYILQRTTHQSYNTLKEALQELLHIENDYQSNVNQQDWVFHLAQPIAQDAWKHTSALAQLHVFMPVSIDYDIDSIIPELAHNLQMLRIPMTLHIIITIGSPNTKQSTSLGTHPALVQLRQRLQGGSFAHTISIVSYSKINQTLTASVGETAMMVCNYLDTFIFSDIGDTLSQHLHPDQHYLLHHAPYSTIGAAKMYIPIAEVSSDIVTRSVERLVHERIQHEPPDDQVKAQNKKLRDVTDLTNLSRIALRGLPIEIRLRYGFWHRIRNSVRKILKLAPEDTEKQLFSQCPKLKLKRSALRDHLRKQGRPLSTEQWWQALQVFRQDVEQNKLQAWCDRAANNLGISLANEQLIAQLRQDLLQDQTFIQGFTQTSPEQQAQHVGAWVAAQRPDLAPLQPSLEKAVLRDVFADSSLNLAVLPTRLPAWLRIWLWQQQTVETGYLDEIYKQLREDIVSLIATQKLGIKLSVVQIKAIEQRYKQTQSILRVWQQFYETEAAIWIPININPTNQPPQNQNPQVQRNQVDQKKWKKRLINALRHQLYPSALFVRLLLLWLIPLYVLVLGVVEHNWIPPEWISTNLVVAVVGWTVGIILFYSIILLLSQSRIWRAKRHLERLVLDNINALIEQRLYADQPEHNQAGIIPTYLRIFDSLIVAHSRGADESAGTPHPPQSLLATLSGTVAQFAQQGKEDITMIPECVVYHPLAYDEVRQMLESNVYNNLKGQPDAWGVQEIEIRHRLTSAAALSDSIKRAIRKLIMQQYLVLVRVSPELKLHKLLKPPMLQIAEHHSTRVQATDLKPLVHDIQLRAKPFFNIVSNSYATVETREDIHILSTSTEVAPLLFSSYQKNRKYRLLLNQTLDPFGLSYIIVVNGLTQELLIP